MAEFSASIYNKDTIKKHQYFLKRSSYHAEDFIG